MYEAQYDHDGELRTGNDADNASERIELIAEDKRSTIVNMWNYHSRSSVVRGDETSRPSAEREELWGT